MDKLFLTSGAFIVPEGVTQIKVTAVAGGGGGASYSGGGGGSGQGCFRRFLNVTPGEVIPITVGAGGSGSSKYYTSFVPLSTIVALSSAIVSGKDGGNTVIGSYITLLGGKGAKTYPATSTIVTGTGECHGEQPTPTLNPGLFNTNYDATGWPIFWRGGNGGASIFGAGGTGGCHDWISSFDDGTPHNGDDAVNFGAGGGGGGTLDRHSDSSGSTFKFTIGGNGANGIVVLEW